MTAQNSATVVKIVDGVMVMSLMEARKPLVWRIEVDKINAASLEIEGDDEAGYTLKLVEAGGASQDVAVFDAMDDAKAVLAQATQELLGVSSGAVGSSCCAPRVHAAGSSGKMHGFFAALTALIVLVVLVVAFASPPKTGVNNVSVVAPTASSVGSAGGQGEAVSADDFLNNR